MTSFWTLFRELFKQKSKSAYWVFLIQFATTLVSFMFSAITKSEDASEITNAQAFGSQVPAPIAWLLIFIIGFLMYSFLADPIFLLMTAWKNEKINRSQTWRLVPMSDGKIYLCNTLSSFCSFIYLIIMQAIVGLIGFIIVYASSDGIRKAIAEGIHKEFVVDHVANIDISNFLFLMLFMILLGLFWYVIVSFLHFTSRAVIDFLPVKANKFVIFIIRAIVLIVVVYFLIFAFQLIAEIGINPSFIKGNPFISNIAPSIISLAILDFVIGAANYGLINGFVEAKQNN